MSAAAEGIAIIGMAGRFPEAPTVDALWQQLLAAREGITRFTPEQLSPGIPAALRQHPRYVAARGVIADADRFDAAFFGIPPREALLMDPQQRVLLELCWNALEDAGVDPQRFPGSIGVYAGTSNNGYRKLVESRADLVQAAGEFATMLANEKDYVATRVAHRLDLTGPALSLHTACSTSLVAVTQAWYALMSWQCDLALAGGINIVVPQASGYLPVEGGMESDDGHCRPFDAAASGTLFSSGGAAVVLKRLAEAVADRDTIYAVIRGVGVNNDGGDKASFSAPSVRGQAAVIRQALDSAGVEAASIGYVEAHGTATPLGDPIEVAALTRAFGLDAATTAPCWLGSVKGNLGHLNAASGVTGLIKATLALHHGKLPATLHYRTPNPEIDFAAGPFKVADRLIDWPRGEQPRRAGVSSFGVGGTNAHVILEEAPLPAATTPGRRVSLLPLSARDAAALQRRASDLAAALAAADAPALPDIGYTLALGRKPMPLRGFVVAAGADEARTRLAPMPACTAEVTPPPLVFLFPGQGSQHVGMARALVAHEPAFRVAFERCCTIASGHLGRDLRALILPAAGTEAQAERALAETRCTQPALFAVEYALAELWESWGLQPAAMIGHSIGEYVAACRAGVFSLEQALALVVARGAAMFAQPPGAMLVVRLGAEALAPRLPDGVEIAGRNAPTQTVLSGSASAIDACAESLARDAIASTRLRVSHGFHSAAMDGALPAFRRAFDGIVPQPPQRAFYSCVSGAPIIAEQATAVDYWCRQLREPVRFADAVQHVLAQGRALLLEVGPSQALTALVRSMLDGRGQAVASLGAAANAGDADEHVLRALGECWCAGIAPDWAAFYAGQCRRRVPLPGYPFRGGRHWVEPAAPSAAAPMAAEQARASEQVASPPAAAVASAVLPPAARAPRLAAELRELFENLSGESIAPAQADESFLNLGLDSLALTQAALEIERRYGVKLKFRWLMEDLGSISRLAALLDATLPADVSVVTAAPVPPPGGSDPALLQLLHNQMALLQQQSALLLSLSGQVPAATQSSATAASAAVADDGAAADLKQRPFGASARITTGRHAELTPAQRAWVADFSRAYGARTAKSKAFSQQHRARMADPRVVTGFHPLWKELTYPIVVERSRGARLWDLDGHEYIDLLNGFGVNFLGYQPDFITAALHAQLDRGIEIGPQHPLTAEVAQLISEMTGMPRVAFCNTGSEAVMGAMRVARTVTGRKTIAIFRDSYHGIFDEVIVRGTRTLRSIAAAPGILASAVENVLVLDYGSDEALRILGEQAHELAAVLIEPVQSKHPTLQPLAFVRELRRLCDAGGCALIFDEVITGFRMAPGGAQEFYGVRADLATYGKIIGGGLPFAAIAGSAHWMDALDGGHWQFGDDSYPEAGVTYFAGTFVRHPLALAAAHAALRWIKAQGPALQAGLNARTAALIEQLNALFKARGAPLTALGYSSLWRILVDDGQPCASLFWYRLRHEGLHVYEQFNCFLSVAHGETEVARIVAAVGAAVGDLLQAGVLSPRAVAEDAAAVPDAVLPLELPLSEGQLEKWLAGQYGGLATLAFNESFRLQLQGTLDVAALRRALETVWSRHEAFRLGFAPDGKTQRVHPRVPLPLVELDYSVDADADAAAARFVAYGEAQMGVAFDTGTPPLLRISLVKLAQHSHGLHVLTHHLVMDGWSVAVFLGELASCYNAEVGGGTVPLAPAQSFRRHVLDQHARHAAPGHADHLDYWKRLYRTPPPPLQLPGDRPPPARPDFAAATACHAFAPELTAALKRAARRRGVSLYSLLLTGFGVLLARLSGQHDFTVGIPFASQAISDGRSLIGDGVNTLPLRLRMDPLAGFAELLSHTHAALLDAAEHQDTTLMSIAQALSLHRRGSGAPLTGIIFNLNPRLPDVAFSGLAHALHDCRRRALMWQLFFNLSDTGQRLTLDLHYATATFDAATIRRWIGMYEDLLGAIAAGGAGVTAHAPAPAVTARVNDQPLTLTGLIEAQTGRTPQRIAVECAGRTLSYAALDRRATAIAQALQARGIGRGDRVGISMPRSEHMLAALLGVMKSGAAYVPLDPSYPAERLRYMAEHAQLRIVLGWTPATLPPAVAAGRELLAVAGIAVDAPPPAAALPELAASDLAYVLYTSGSTGQPKGVCIAQRSLVNLLTSMRTQPGIDADDVLCAVTTLSFDIAGLELYLPLLAGARVLIATDEQQRDPPALLQLLGERGASLLQGTPALLRLLVEHDHQRVLQGLRLLVGGEALPRELANTLAGRCRELWNMYGPTETTIWSSLMRVLPGTGPVPLGHPVAHTRLHVLDAQGQPLPEGETGEVWIGGDGVADGYLFRPELTAERFRPDPFAADGSRMYCTGDLGSLRLGVLYFHGRTDQQVKLRGYRIELGEIEAAARAVPGVREAVAQLCHFAEGDARLVLHAVADTDDATLAARLREQLQQQLPSYMLPQHVEWLAALPLTPNGKVDRQALPPPAGAAAVAQTSAARVSAQSQLASARERQLASHWSELVGISDIRSGDNFFDIGGHSLLAVELVTRVQRDTGVRLNLLDVATGTLASLATELPDFAAAPMVSLGVRLRRLLGLR